MSNRHRASRETAPDAAHPAPSKQERRAANRRARQRTHELLSRADAEVGEALVTPRPRHTAMDMNPAELPENNAPAKPGREYRHWKQKFWKRRSSERARRAELAEEQQRSA